MSADRPGLAELRSRARAALDPAECRRLVRRLRADPRSGAQELADAIESRLARDAAEARRLAALYARTEALRASGARAVAGVDEVGIGPLAGPVVAAAVILPARAELPGLDDSKRLDARARERLAAAIRAQAVALAVAEIEAAEVDRLNVRRAGLEAMRRAVLALALPPDHVLVDAFTIPGLAAPQSAIVGGDGLEAPIAAASIVAKVHRDEIMCRIDEAHPGYGFARHKGYATAEHLDALRRLGPCPLHRRSFAPVVGAP